MSSTVSSSFYRTSLLDPPGATTNTTTTMPTAAAHRPAPIRRFSSASVIAQITLLGYPPKIQPQSSATRDQGREQQLLLQQSSPVMDRHDTATHNAGIPTTCSPLDALDEEAGCILIALANHDPTNNKKLLPATATATTAKIMTADTVSTTSTASSSSSTSTSTSSDNSPASTPTKSSPATHNGNSMSIRNLLGGSSDHARGLTLKSSRHRHPEDSADSKNGSNSHVTWQKDDEDEDDENDPIMILAAAAAAVNNQDQGKGSLYDTYGYRDDHQHHYENINNNSNTSGRSKRKWHGYQYMAPDDYPPTAASSDAHLDKRHRYQPGSSAQERTWRQDETEASGSSNPSGNTKDAFSWQYLSMKQNPRIKRNAMHAYITYMIYTDMTQSQAVNTLKRQDTSKLTPVGGSSTSTSSNRPHDSAAPAPAVSPPPPAPTSSSQYSPPPPPAQQQQQQGSASYRFQTTAGNDEEYIYCTSGDRAPNKSEIPTTGSASTPYPTPSHTEMTIPYPADNTTNAAAGGSAGTSTPAPSEWYHHNRSSYFSSASGANTNDSSNRMASTAIVDRPLTAFLWDDQSKPLSGGRQDGGGGIALPPLSSTPFPSSSPSPRV